MVLNSLHCRLRFVITGRWTDFSYTHPYADPNPKTYRTRPKVIHDAISDTKTEQQKTDHDVGKRKKSCQRCGAPRVISHIDQSEVTFACHERKYDSKNVTWASIKKYKTFSAFLSK